MAISFVAAGTEASGTSGTTVTPALPAGIANDDILILLACTERQSSVGSMTGDWSLLAHYTGSLGQPTFDAWWRRYDGTDTSRVLTFSGSSGDDKVAGIFAVRGCKTSGSPFNATGSVGSGSADTISHSSITTTVDNCLLLCLNGTRGDDNRTTLSSGFTNVFEDSTSGTNNAYFFSNSSIHASYKDQGTQGATGSLSIVCPFGTANWASILVALEPAGSGSQTLTPSLFTNSNTFYAQTVTRGARTLTPSLFTNTNAFYAPVVRSVTTLTPAKYTDADTFYAPTVSRGAATLAPALFVNANVLYSATVSRGSVTLSPSLFTNGQTFYGPSVSYRLKPTPFTNSNSFYSPTVARGSVTLSPSLYSDPDGFYAATVGRGSVSLTPPLFSDGDSFFGPTVSTQTTLSPALYTDPDTFFAPTVARGPVTLTPSLFSDADTFYAATITNGGTNLSPPLFVDADVFFAPSVSRGAVTLSPSLFTDADSFFGHVVGRGPVSLQPSLFSNSNVFFSSVVSAVHALLPSLFENSNIFYSPTVTNSGSTELFPSFFENQNTFFVAIISRTAGFITNPLGRLKMYVGSMGSVSNREDWIVNISLLDDDEEAFNLNGCEVVVYVCRRGCPDSPVLSAAVGNGIVLYDSYTLQWHFNEDQMATLCPQQYDVFCRVERDEITTQLLAANIAIVEGGPKS